MLRDGEMRFARGFGGEDTLALVLVPMVVRVMLLLVFPRNASG